MRSKMEMENYLKNLPKEVLTLINLARNIAQVQGISAYLVGGFVRDLLLGVKNLDLDIAVEGEGVRFAEELALRLKARLIRHRRFGTATIIVTPHQKIDIATARSESYPVPACLPVVTAGTIKDDLFRRDFTINAMAIGINGKNLGELLDIFGGKIDLQNKRIRILHNFSFIDDPTRILRAIRFEQRYNFEIETYTLKLIKEATKLKMLEKVGPQRLRNELILILKESHPIRQIRRLEELCGFRFINPKLSLSKKTYNLLLSIENQLSWFRHNFPRLRKLDTWIIYLMGLLDSLSTKDAKSACKRFVFRKGEEKRILSYKKSGFKIIQQLNRDKVRPSKIYALLEPLSYEVTLLLKAKTKNRFAKSHIYDFFKKYNGMRILISGKDLANLRISPGPDYEKVFSSVLKSRLNGRVRTKKEELALAKIIMRLE